MRCREKVQAEARTTDTWWLDLKFSTAQIHIPIPNRKSYKMYENLIFLLKKWLSNAKSWTRGYTVIKFEQIELPKTLKHPKIPQSVQNILKKLSLVVRSSWLCTSSDQHTYIFHLLPPKFIRAWTRISPLFLLLHWAKLCAEYRAVEQILDKLHLAFILPSLFS